jgi:cytochrome c oxidase assembly protein subunit 15
MRKILWASLIYTLLVIVWGAWVRISHSGDGCGATWPLCQDQLIPIAAQSKTWVEYTHRAMSGIYGIMILVLTLMAHRRTDSSPELKRMMKLTFFFMITEALLGAKLVTQGLVGTNDTPFRAFVMSLHFTNSLLLTGSLALSALFAAAKVWRRKQWIEIHGVSQRILRRIPAGTIVIFLLIGITGTIAALSNTLYPANSLLAGLAADLDANSHYLIRLRGLHPTLGFFLGTGLTIFFYLMSEMLGEDQSFLRDRAFRLALGFAALVIVGSITILAQAPVPLKLLHLTLAHGTWILILSMWHSLRFAPATDSPQH